MKWLFMVASPCENWSHHDWASALPWLRLKDGLPPEESHESIYERCLPLPNVPKQAGYFGRGPAGGGVDKVGTVRPNRHLFQRERNDGGYEIVKWSAGNPRGVSASRPAPVRIAPGAGHGRRGAVDMGRGGGVNVAKIKEVYERPTVIGRAG